MEHKKKFLGGLKVLLFALFIILLGLFSTSYASTQMPLDKMEYMIDNIFYQANGFTNTKYASSYFSNSYYKDFVLGDSFKDNSVSAWLTYFNSNNDIDFNYNFSDFLGYFAYYSNGYDNFAGSFYYAKANLGVGSSYHPYIKFYNNNFLNKNYGEYPFYVMFLDDDKNIFSTSIRAIDFTYNRSSHSFSFTNLRTINSISSEPQNYLITRTVANWNVSNTNISSIEMIPGIVTFYNTGSVYTNFDGTNFFNTPVTKLLKTGYISSEPENPESPDIPDDTGNTGVITDNSGDVTGSIDLSGIQNQLGLINKNSLKSGEVANILSGETQKIINNQNQNTQAIVNTISGEVNKITNTITQPADFNNRTITSGDIENSLNFQFMADPYDNFWYEMTQGLKTSLIGSVRQLPVNWLGYPGYFDLDGLINYPQPIKNILTTVSTVCMVWLLVKWWKIIIDKLTSGDVDEVLAMNEEERYCRLILGGVYMLEAIFNFIIDLFLWLVGIIGSIIIYPIQLLLVTLIPGLDDFISVTLGFFNNYIWNYLSFIKELFLDVSCLPRSLWSIFIIFVFARWLIAPAIRSIKLIINIWKLKSGGATK